MLSRTWLSLGLIASLSFFARGARADADAEARKAFEQGVSASNEAHWEDARRAFQHSLDLVVKPSTLFNLAVADLKLGLTQEALDALGRFQRLANPKQHSGMLERAATLLAEAERNKEAAVPAKERARSLIEPGNLSDDARTSYTEGRDAYARGEDQLALDAFERAHRESGRNEFLFHIGIAADRLRQDERAVDAFSRFIDLFPEVPEAEQARRHLDRLTRVLAERDRPEPAATIAVRREEGLSSPRPVAAPELGAPRGVLIAGAAVAAGALGSAAWWANRSSGRRGRCLDDEQQCENFDDVQREQRAAMGLTISLSVTALGLLTGGGVWLHKRKQDVALTGVSVGALRHALVASARFSF